MRGLFNEAPAPTSAVMLSFNPPCGCVAFSTTIAHKCDQVIPVFQSALRMRGLFNRRALEQTSRLVRVSIRLADAWPFQPRIVSCPRRTPITFQSALRMRGLFNRRSDTRAAGCCGSFQSALRMRGLFNSRNPANLLVGNSGFNPPCGCVAFSTTGSRTGSVSGSGFQSALRMRGLFN